MNIAGLNNILPQSQPAPKADKATQSNGERASSFERVLGQAAANEKTQAKSNSQQQPKADERKNPTADRDRKSDLQPKRADAEQNLMPNRPGGPEFVSPVGGERTSMLTAPPQVVNPAAKSVPAPLNADGDVDSLTRRVVWNEFLRKMKEELGINPEDVLQAFATLPAEELAKPPQQTLDQVVAALGLGPDQAATAKQYLQELVNKTQSQTLGDELAASQKQISLTLMSQREMHRRDLSRSLENMNQSFFMNDPKGHAHRNAQSDRELSQLSALLGTAAPAADVMSPAASSAAMPSAPLMAAQMPQVPVGMAQTVTPHLAGQVKPAGQAAAQAGAAPMSTDGKLNIDDLIQKFSVSRQSAQAVTPVAEALPAPSLLNTAPAAGASAAVAASLNPLLGLEKGFADDSGSSEDEFSSDASYLMAGYNPESMQTQGLGTENFQTQLTQQTAPNQPVSVPELIDRAQVLVHDGGGEMKVTLNQEGLGEVAMKVNVSDGKVNVQMITESDEAKKLIERELGDLKAQLANNSLQVDTIKIDTATNIGKQLDQQYQDAQRQMAQQTLEQFRQDHQGWRRSFFEMPSVRTYKGQGEAPRDLQPPVTASGRRPGDRRLDLVA